MLRTDWSENLSDKFILKHIVKMPVQLEKSWFGLTDFKTSNTVRLLCRDKMLYLERCTLYHSDRLQQVVEG